MSAPTTSVTITDENLSGETIHEFTLDSLTESMTVRELIRARIYQGVADYNRERGEPTVFFGLVEPGERETALNGSPEKRKRRKVIDWQCQFETACKAFEQNGFFVIVGDRQAESLDETFSVTADAGISFVKLMPLIGG